MALVCATDYEAHAKLHLSKKTWDFYSAGARPKQTLRENCAAYERLRLRPRVLRDVSHVETEVTVLGQKMAFPIGVSPTAYHGLAHPDREVATAKAACSLKTCMTLSLCSNASMEDVAAAAPDGLRWLQLYILSDRELTRRMVRRAEAAGFRALAVTVDQPVIGKRGGMDNFLPPGMGLGNFPYGDGVSSTEQMRRQISLVDGSLTWKDIDWLRSVTRLPVIVKGIYTAEDAREAVRHGVAAVWVSNHGARQLDGVPATIEVLPEVVAAVDGKVEVFVDGGIRYGTDVLKALALGARAVFLGRPVLWGLAHSGEEGVRNALEILRNEFRSAMALAGCSRISDIEKSLVAHERHFRQAHL